MRRLALTLAVLASTIFATDASAAKPSTFGPVSGVIPLVVNESKHRFELPARRLVVRPGIQNFTTIVPKTAKGRHGIAISGEYGPIYGASVKPGRTSSITITLGPGIHTVFDGYKKNRSKGFAFKIEVLKNKGRKLDLGTDCMTDVFGATFSQAWLTGATCKTANEVAEDLDEAWRKSDFAWAPLTVANFACTFEPFAATGLTTTCLSGDQRIIFAANYSAS